MKAAGSLKTLLSTPKLHAVMPQKNIGLLSTHQLKIYMRGLSGRLDYINIGF